MPSNCFFPFELFVLLEKKRKKCERNTETSNQVGFEQIGSTLRVLSYCIFGTIKSNDHHHQRSLLKQ